MPSKCYGMTDNGYKYSRVERIYISYGYLRSHLHQEFTMRDAARLALLAPHAVERRRRHGKQKGKEKRKSARG